MRAQVIVGERLLDQPLTVVEGTANAQRCYVVAERRHLRLLHVADLPFRIQDDDARVADAMERLSDSAAGVAGGRNQDGQWSSVGEVMQQPCLHPCANVLERERRTVKELE